MKIYSNSEISKIFIGALLFIWILTLLIVMTNHSLSCVNEYGCLRIYCDYNWLRPEYKKIVLANQNNCPYQTITTSVIGNNDSSNTRISRMNNDLNLIKNMDELKLNITQNRNKGI